MNKFHLEYGSSGFNGIKGWSLVGHKCLCHWFPWKPTRKQLRRAVRESLGFKKAIKRVARSVSHSCKGCGTDDDDNLELLCASCHRAKIATERLRL